MLRVTDTSGAGRFRGRSRSSAVALAAAFMMTVMAVAPASAQQSRSHRISGDDIAIYNIAGKVQVQRGNGRDVVVEVDRGGSDGEALSVEVGVVGGRQAFRVIYPDDRIVYREGGWGSRTRMWVRRDGTFGGQASGGRRVDIFGRSSSGLDAHADLTVSIPDGKKVAVYIGVGRIDAENISGDFRLDTNSGEVTADRVRGSLLVDTGSGRVVVTNVEGDLDVDTGSGSVKISRISGDFVRVDTGSGRVTGSEIEATKLEVDTGSGGIDIDEVNARDIKLDTGSGSVTVGLLSDVHNMVIDTGSGGVTVRVPRSLGAEIEIDTGSGGINVDVPIDYRRKERSYVRGTIGDGEGRIYIDTGSGSVRIHPR